MSYASGKSREHFNVQINVQRVQHVDGTGRGDDKRVVTELVSLNVTADTEPAAYFRAHRLLSAVTGVGEGQEG